MPRSYHELERECLDEFNRAALGRKWPLEWLWNLGDATEERRGVALDETFRVATLYLDFGEDEGEARCTVETLLS